MATYNNKQSVLDEALGIYADYGFILKEPDDHFTELFFKDIRVGIYVSQNLTIETIRESCRKFFERMGGI